MGTTESIFLGNEELEGHPEPPPPLTSRVSPYAQHSRPLASPAQPRPTARQRPPTDSHRLPSHRRSIVQQSESPKAPPTPGILLNGTVLGLSASGKRTLLQRLEGKEPAFNAPRNSKGAGSGDIDSVSESEVSAVAPYRAPPQLPAFDEHIQLQVQTSRKATKKADADFYVVLIDPRHDRTKIEKYLGKTIRSALRAQGYGREAPQRPFCLCLLRNFHDLVPDDDREDCISESDLTAWTMEILQDYPDMDPASLVLHCTNTSLINCFGLGLVHHFIYQAYVQRKQYDLEQQLRLVQEAVTRSRHEAPATVSYDEYLAEIDRLTRSNGDDGSRRGRQHQHDDETATTATSSGAGRRKIVPQQQQQHEDLNRRRRASSGESSSTLPSSIQQSLDNAKDALEAFFESDSDDDENMKHQDTRNDDDSDEEGFFYDESGIRNNAKHFKSNSGQARTDLRTSNTAIHKEDTNESILVGSKEVSAEETGTNENESSQVTEGEGEIQADTSTSGEGEARADTGAACNGPSEDELKSQQSDEKLFAAVDSDSGQNIERYCDVPDRKSIDDDHVTEATTDRQKNASNGVSLKKVGDEDDSDSEFFIDEQKTELDCGTSAETGGELRTRLRGSDDEEVPDYSPPKLVDGKGGSDMDESGNGKHADEEDQSRKIRDPDITVKGAEDYESSSEFVEPKRDDVLDDAPRVSSAELSSNTPSCATCAKVELSEEETVTGGAKSEGGPQHALSKTKENGATDMETKRKLQAVNTVSIDENAASSSPNDAPAASKPQTATASQLSEAARAAIAAAQQDFERMLQESEEKTKKPKKKKKEDGEKKQKKEKKGKSKRESLPPVDIP